MISARSVSYFLVLALSLIALAILPAQNDFLVIFGCYSLAFTAYLLLFYHLEKVSLSTTQIIMGVLILRLLLIPWFPNLSDDLYRFYFDGHLLLNGLDPFAFTPNQWPDELLPGTLKSGVIPHLNSPNYFSVYPPVCQVLFAIGSWVSGSNIHIFAGFLKFLFAITDTINIWILLKICQIIGRNKNQVLLYAINPLILIELHQNLHFEMFMLFFLSLGLLMLATKKIGISASAIGMAISTKLVPLIGIPFFIRNLDLRKGAVYTLVAFGIFILSFLPFWSDNFFQNYFSSIDLYFRNFEFNGAIYTLAQRIGIQIKGYNWISVIGPLLSSLALISIILLWWKTRIKVSFLSILSTFSIAFSIYLLFATTVHPWYLSIPIMLLPFTNHKYILFWSWSIFISYIAYSLNPIEVPVWALILEYLPVFYLLWQQRNDLVLD